MIKCIFDKGRCCSALVEKHCSGCNFCKTRDQYIESNSRAKARINSLSEKQKNHILFKYYYGRTI